MVSFCPAATEYFTAVITGQDGTPGDFHFRIANATSLAQVMPRQTAVDDVVGDAFSAPSGVFDWGLAAFFGRRIFTAIDGASTPYGTGPYYAF